MRWTTKLVEMWDNDSQLRRDGKLRDLLDKGSLEFPKGSPYLDQTKLRSTDEFDCSEVEVDEMLKVFSDFDRLVENHIPIDGGKLKLRGYQKDILDQLHNSKYDIFCHSRQIGMSMLMRLHILRCVYESKDVVVVCSDSMERRDDIKNFKELLENLPYYMQPAMESYDKTRFIFKRSKVVFTNSTRGYEDTPVMIFSDAGFNLKFREHWEKTITLRRVSRNEKLQTIIFSGSNMGSYFNHLFTLEKYDGSVLALSIFNKHTYTHNVVSRQKGWEDNLRGFIGDKQFMIEYSCCMDEKQLKRADVLGNILNK